MPFKVTTIKIKRADLLETCRKLLVGDAVVVSRIPPGATLLTSEEDLANQLFFKDEIEIRYSLDTAPPVTVSVALAPAGGGSPEA